MINIGIDPDLRKNGVAIMQDGEYKELLALTFPELTVLISESKGKDILFTLEDVNTNKPTFYRGRQNQAKMNRISQNVGMVKATGSLIGEFLEFSGVPFELVPPIKGKLKECKENAELFKKLTGWEGKTNADKRDAAMLIFKYKK